MSQFTHSWGRTCWFKPHVPHSQWCCLLGMLVLCHPGALSASSSLHAKSKWVRAPSTGEGVFFPPPSETFQRARVGNHATTHLGCALAARGCRVWLRLLDVTREQSDTQCDLSLLCTASGEFQVVSHNLVVFPQHHWVRMLPLLLSLLSGPHFFVFWGFFLCC